jgi:hypothetical protein
MTKRPLAVAALLPLVVACRGSLAGSGNGIPLGGSALLEKDVEYTVVGTPLTVRSHGARMTTGTVGGDPNKETHSVHAELELRANGERVVSDVADTAPFDWQGYRVRVDAQDFTWGKSTVRVAIDRIPR